LKKYINQKVIPKAIGMYLGGLSYLNPIKSGDKALEIFGTPRKGKIRERDATYLMQFEQSILQYENYTIQQYKKGNGALKILLLHGWESNTARWKHLITYIEESIDCTIYAIDAPAHGASSGKEFNSILYGQFINQFCSKNCPDVIIGHSIGAGSIAYCMSEIKHHPIAKIIIMGSPNEFTEIMNTYVNIIGLNKNGQVALQEAIIRKYNLRASDYSVSKYVKAIQAKGLIIHDTDDEVSVIANANLIANNFKGAELYVTNGFGHSLQHKSIFEKIVQFIKE
jgi:pimeloyl-ACP methyl ester carboxylesterase